MPTYVVKCSICGKEFTREASLPPIVSVAGQHDWRGKAGVPCVGSGQATLFVRQVRRR